MYQSRKNRWPSFLQFWALYNTRHFLFPAFLLKNGNSLFPFSLILSLGQSSFLYACRSGLQLPLEIPVVSRAIKNFQRVWASVVIFSVTVKTKRVKIITKCCQLLSSSQRRSESLKLFFFFVLCNWVRGVQSSGIWQSIELNGVVLPESESGCGYAYPRLSVQVYDHVVLCALASIPHPVLCSTSYPESCHQDSKPPVCSSHF